MKRVTKLISFFAVLVFAIGLVGCGLQSAQNDSAESSGTENKDKGEMKIGMSFGFSMVPYFIAQKLGAETAAAELGVELVVTTANNNLATQVSDVENLVQQGADAVLFSPIDSAGMAPITEQVREQGIGAFTVDMGVTGTEVDGHVASDNYEIGVMAAKKMGELTGGKGEIAIVGWSTVEATIEREKGFKDTLEKEFPDIKVVAYQDGGMNKEKGMAATENILQAHSEIVAIFGSNQQAALGAINGIQSANSDVFVVGVDSDVESLQTIISNPKYKALVSQDPYAMGYQSVYQAVAWLKEQEYQKIERTPISMVTAENAEEFLVKEQEYQDIYKKGQ